MISTLNKTCLEGAYIEVQPQGNLFKDISVCGNWCTKYLEEYECCVDVLYKYTQIKNNFK